MNEEQTLTSGQNPALPLLESVPKVPVPVPSSGKVPTFLWVLAGGMAIVVIGLLAALLFVQTKKTEVSKLVVPIKVVISVSPTPTVSDFVGAPLSSSDNISDIEKDVTNTDLSTLGQELDSIDSELFL